MRVRLTTQIACSGSLQDLQWRVSGGCGFSCLGQRGYVDAGKHKGRVERQGKGSPSSVIESRNLTKISAPCLGCPVAVHTRASMVLIHSTSFCTGCWYRTSTVPDSGTELVLYRGSVQLLNF